MEGAMKGVGKTAIWMAKGNTLGRMEGIMKGIIITIKK
jgi:hypothetical protein